MWMRCHNCCVVSPTHLPAPTPGCLCMCFVHVETCSIALLHVCGMPVRFAHEGTSAQSDGGIDHKASCFSNECMKVNDPAASCSSPGYYMFGVVLCWRCPGRTRLIAVQASTQRLWCSATQRWQWLLLPAVGCCCTCMPVWWCRWTHLPRIDAS